MSGIATSSIIEDNELMRPYRVGQGGRPGQSLQTARHPGRYIDLEAIGLTISEEVYESHVA